MARSYEGYMRDAEKPAILNRALALEAKQAVFCSEREPETSIVPHYSMQKLLRPLYGKGEPGKPDIGDHPDFRCLKETNEEVYCPITTLFMDIEGSTRLSLLHTLPRVKKIKNAYICATIEIVRAFDGHVHRIMGDAVMAYFGGTSGVPEDAAIDAMNCASVLRYFVDSVVVPALRTEGFDDPFGVRIGIDHGKKEDVLWSAYGYPGIEEVTATSFYVDVAAKLQQAAGRNEIMIGDSLRQILDFPRSLLRVKTAKLDGLEVQKPYVEPNHVDGLGKPINYCQHVLDWNGFLDFTPIGQADPVRTSKMEVKAQAYESLDKSESYAPSSRRLPKQRLLRFEVKMPYIPKLPYTLTFRVENHGDEATTKAPLDRGDHVTTQEITTNEQHHKISHYEATAYKGFHFLIVEATSKFGLSMKTSFGVFIE